MGGNAIRLVELVRLGAADYFPLMREVQLKLQTVFVNSRIALIPAYKTKSSFGDGDFLVELDDVKANIRDEIKTHFEPTEIVKNSNVWSFDYFKFQIDIILTPTRFYQTSLDYFSHSDMGNLNGKIGHKLGVKLGHDGLKYVFRDGTNEIGNIYLSDDVNKNLRFIGLNPQAFHQGFETLEDIFQYVASSEFFNPDIYLLDNLNHISRIRDRKRKTYQEFLKWCNLHNSNLRHYQFDKDKSVYYKRIQEWFPEFELRMAELRQKQAQRRARHEKFNGDIVMELTKREGKELGVWMMAFKGQFDDFNDWVDKTNPEEVRRQIANFVCA